MGKNLLQRQEEMNKAMFSAGEDVGLNRTLDMIMLVLTDPKYMGKDTFGKKRFLRIWEGLKEMDKQYCNAFTDDVDADVCQEKIDARWKALLGDDAQTFYERYPMLKKFDYTKSKKKWRQ